jgi:hypothetical protein
VIATLSKNRPVVTKLISRGGQKSMFAVLSSDAMFCGTGFAEHCATMSKLYIHAHNDVV